MIFEDTYITDAGQALITRATAGTKIIWGECGCFEHTGINAMSDAQINALTALNNKCAGGQASAVYDLSGESGKTRITCQCSNAETGCSAGQALAFGLWGKIEGDASYTLVAIARTGSYTPTTFPTYDGTVQTRLIGIVELTITVQPGAATTIAINPSLYALANNLQDLAEHAVVTTDNGETVIGKVGGSSGCYVVVDQNGTGELVENKLVAIGNYGSEGNTYIWVAEGGIVMNSASNVVLKSSNIDINTNVSIYNNKIINFNEECWVDKSSIRLEGESSTEKTYSISVCESGISSIKSTIELTSDSSNEGKIDLTVYHSSNTMKGLHITKTEFSADIPFRADGGIKGITPSKQGCPILAFIPANTYSTTYSPGTSISVTYSTVKYAKITGTGTITGGNYLTAGTYTLLSEYTETQDSVVLLMVE